MFFFQLMLLGKFVDGDNDIFGHVFQLCIHSVSFLQKYGLFRGTPMFLFFFLFGRIKRVKCDVLNEIISVYLQI